MSLKIVVTDRLQEFNFYIVVCQNGRYGPGCDEKCGNCYNTATCNKTTGYCPGKCMLGYQGKRCKRGE